MIQTIGRKKKTFRGQTIAGFDSDDENSEDEDDNEE